MARGETISVIGIEKVTKDLDKMFKEFTVKRKIVDSASLSALKPWVAKAKNIAPVAEKEVPAFLSGNTGFSRKAIPVGTLRDAIRTRKKKNWRGLIISHGARAKHDAWFWRFMEYGWIMKSKHNPNWGDGKFKQPRSFGKFRSLLSGSQRNVLDTWLKKTEKGMKRRIKKMDVKIK